MTNFFSAMNSSMEKDSKCLIDLAQGSSTNQTSMISVAYFPPISTDEMIVKTFGRMSIDNNPFDTAENEAKMYDDPFEIKRIAVTPRKSLCHHTVPTGSLIEVDDEQIEGSQSQQLNSLDNLSSISDCTPQINFADQYANQISSICEDDLDENSSDPLNKGMITTTSIQTNESPLQISPSGKRSRVQSDPDTTMLSKRRMDLGKSRSTSLDQLLLKSQLLKKLTNSPLNSPNRRKSGKGEMNLENPVLSGEDSFIQSLANSSTHSAFDDLMSTKPEWIDSENEDSDIEGMTIPFLKNIQHNESIAELIDESTHKDRDDIIEKLSKYKKTCSDSTEDSEGKMDSVNEGETIAVQEIDIQSKDSLISMIGTLRDVVNKCGDEKSKGEASAVLDNLNIYLNNYAQNTSIVLNNSEPTPIIRQRTFSMERKLPPQSPYKLPVINDLVKTLPEANLVSQLPNISKCNAAAAKRKSFGSSIPSSPARLSRSFSHSEKQVAVATVQSHPQSRRSNIFNAASRLTRRSSVSAPIETKSTHSTSRQSLTSPSKESNSTLPKQISRKTIMKPSHPLPRSSNIAAKSLKVRVGEQTKLGGPLKAVIPYESISSLNRSVLSLNQSVTNVSVDVQKRITTSTPILSSARAKSGLPTSSSTPMNDNAEKTTTKSVHLAPNRNRLSYVPTTPKSNLKSRQPTTDRKRNVTFDNEVTDKMSTSMIVGRSSLMKQESLPITPTQKKRLSRSLTINKENGVLQKK